MRTLLAGLALTWILPPTVPAQMLPSGASSPQVIQPAAAPAIPPSHELVYSGAAVVATGFKMAGREVVCGLGEIAGFFTLAVVRLPVWAVTLGDRFGSSEPLQRIGDSIVDKACGGSWVVTSEQLKAWGEPQAATTLGTSTTRVESPGP